ncbi:MAG: helix-turn-helix transcriptional regulator [Eubacteriales bacterium]|nr:helix-turn-helix transcriptional regulator [Eubacteriales bacterium]
MELNERLTALRKSKGMTQEAMAQALFVSRQTIYKWESGKAQPDLGKFSQICKLFDVSADSLLSESFGLDTQENDDEPAEEESEDDSPAPVAVTAPAVAEKIKEASAPSVSENQGSFILTKHRCVTLCTVIVLVFVAITLLWVAGRQDKEIQAAQEAGIIGTDIQTNAASISERDFLQMLLSASKLRYPDELVALSNAVVHASGQRLTREKAAYWLYCTHVWMTIDAHADMSIGKNGENDPISQRNVYEELNEISRAKVNLENEPWDAFVCEETQEANRLFESYDGTAEMDAQILTIMDGVYYTAVTFCACFRPSKGRSIFYLPVA